MVDDRFVYLIATIPFWIIWAVFFLKRPDLRKEMLVMSLLVGFLSVVTSYYWWTIDWWQPLTITGTRVGVEDFILGFMAGGIMAVIYEIIFKKALYERKIHHHTSGGFTILLLLAQVTTWLFYAIGLTSFWSSAIAMTLVAAFMVFMRKDLFVNGVLSGILMTMVSLLFYYLIMIVSQTWIDNTYFSGLSGLRVTGIPIEELVFWFLAGFVFGPFYEYWQGEKLKRFVHSSR